MKARIYLGITFVSVILVIVAVMIIFSTSPDRNGFWFLIDGAAGGVTVFSFRRYLEARQQVRAHARQTSRQWARKRIRDKQGAASYLRPGVLHRRNPHFFPEPTLTDPPEFRLH